MSVVRVSRLVALAVVLGLAPTARAALITYSTQLQVGGMTVPSATGTTSPPPPGIGSASVAVTPVSGAGPFDPGFAGVAIPIGALTADTTGLATTNPVVSDTLGTGVFTLILTVTDQATLDTGTLTFVGSVGGSVFTAPEGGMLNRIALDYASLTPAPFNQTRTVEAGGVEYQVTLLAAGLVLNSNQLVAASNFQVQIVAAAVPEPAAATLAAVGAVGLLGYARIRRGGRQSTGS